MMRLPAFAYHAPNSAREVVEILAGEGPSASIVAGGTDLFPNMKRRHQTPKTLVSLQDVDELRGVSWQSDGSLRIGPGEILRALERDADIGNRLPALVAAVRSISTPVLRNMGTIGGNLCLDTRCNYYNQNYEWRRAINFCLKCDGDTCWVAPGSKVCWAVNSSDTAPVMMALGAKLRLISPRGTREVDAQDFFQNDGIDYLAKKPDELLTDIEIPDQGKSRSVYLKLRRRDAFDFPVLGVAARIELDGEVVKNADIVINAVSPAPTRANASEKALIGKKMSDDVLAEAALLAYKPSKPLDNTDFEYAWRKKMVKVYVRRALEHIRSSFLI